MHPVATWADKAALLDPEAYEYVYAANWSQTVPAGEVWWALNLWNVRINGCGPYYHRRLHIGEAMMLTQGTTLSAGSDRGFAYICKPSLVPPPMDAKALAKARLDHLRSLPQITCFATVPTGSPTGHFVGASFSADFEKGMLNHCSSRDVCWTILVGNQVPDSAPPAYDSLNTLDEVNDNHVIRFTGNILCPFKRSQWNGLWVQQASNAGNYSDPSSIAGYGGVIYQKLPADW